MRPVRKKRLFAIIYILLGMGLVTTFVLMAMKENLNHFYTPTQISNGEAAGVRSLRVGGMVKDNTVERSEASLEVNFVVTDFEADVPVVYEGILPDLFREGQGVVVIGELNEANALVANQVLAKHDENYMPPEAKKALEASGHYKPPVEDSAPGLN